MAHYIASARLYLDKDGKVVDENDPNRASLLVPAGGRLPVERAEELGLTKELTLEESPKEVKPGENKMVAGPQATKAAQALAEEKGVELAEIEGSGADGRVLVADVEAVEAPPPAPAEEAPAKPAKAAKK
jgi:pyruvate dehydrogenase E2 component (dihydrolipoamide acetyltransferase)